MSAAAVLRHRKRAWDLIPFSSSYANAQRMNTRKVYVSVLVSFETESHYVNRLGWARIHRNLFLLLLLPGSWN